jgi:hypothetical protein
VDSHHEAAIALRASEVSPVPSNQSVTTPRRHPSHQQQSNSQFTNNPISEPGLLGFWKTTQQHTYTKPTSTRKSDYSTYSQHLLETDAYRTTIPKPNANMDGSGFRKLPLEVKTMV